MLTVAQRKAIFLTTAAGVVVIIAAFLMRGADSNAVRWDSEVGGDTLPVAAVEKTFAALGYDFSAVRSGRAHVPRVLVRNVPDDLGQVPEVDRRKDLFLGAVLPVVLAINEQLSAERATVEKLAGKIRFREPLSSKDLATLKALAERYGVIAPDDAVDLADDAVIEELLLRAAPVPVSLALAQAAEESAWGLSRFAAEGNALFGQWVWNDDAGMVPRGRRPGETHSVRAFDDIYQCTLSYVNNLNTHRAYGGFRRMRANMLAATGRLDGHALAGALTRYSGRGQAYVDSLRSIIRANDLAALDRARLSGRGEAVLAAS
jgi:Bax protein